MRRQNIINACNALRSLCTAAHVEPFHVACLIHVHETCPQNRSGKFIITGGLTAAEMGSLTSDQLQAVSTSAIALIPAPVMAVSLTTFSTLHDSCLGLLDNFQSWNNAHE